MEKIPTVRRATLPWVANLATLTVVVGATWWSSAQRPQSTEQDLAAAPTSAASQPGAQALPAKPTPVLLQPRQPAAPQSEGTLQAGWQAPKVGNQDTGAKPVVFTTSAVLR